MTREDYLKKLLEREIIQYEYTGSECSMDCVRFTSNIFYGRNSYALFIRKMAWDGIEKTLSEYLSDAIGSEELQLTWDVIVEDESSKRFVFIFDKNKSKFIKDQNGSISFHETGEAYAYLLNKHVFDSIFELYSKEGNLAPRIRISNNGNSTDYYLDITEETENIFGDIVQKVEISISTAYGSKTEKELGDEILNNACSIITQLKIDPTRVDFCAETLCITFKNGKQIEIWNSECAGLCKISESC